MRAPSIVWIGNPEGISSVTRCAQLAGKRGSSVHIELLLQALTDGDTLPAHTPFDAMAHPLTLVATHAGIALTEAPPRKRRQLRDDLQVAMH